jgi:hypothetical protein
MIGVDTALEIVINVGDRIDRELHDDVFLYRDPTAPRWQLLFIPIRGSMM